jgi:carbon monoxide dehydrogenase subunit G
MRIEESITIDRQPDEVFGFLAHRSNDSVWMASVKESTWLDPDEPLHVGRRGRMVQKIMGRRSEYIDEITDFEPGHKIAHRTVEGPMDLNTACLTEPDGGGTRVTVVAETDTFVRGPFAVIANPIVAGLVRRAFRRDLARLKGVFRSQTAPLDAR